MRYIIILAVSLVALFSCSDQKRTVRLDLPLRILSSDTTFLGVGPLQTPFTKFKISPSIKTLMIHHGRKVFWFNLISNKLDKVVDFDSTSIMPEMTLLNVHFDEQDSSLYLFFPTNNKIIQLNSDEEIIGELELEKPGKYAQRFAPYGSAFFMDRKKNSFYIGLMSDKSKTGGTEEFLNDSRFIGRFDRNTGEIQNLFGDFGDYRKENPMNALSEGLYTVDFYGEKFFLREAIGSENIRVFDSGGDVLKSIRIGTSYMNFDLISYDGGELNSSIMNDNFYTIKVLNDSLIGSNLITHSREECSENKHEGHLLIEDTKNGESYSTEISPFCRLLGGDSKYLYLVLNHPTKEDLILVRLKYQLGTE